MPITIDGSGTITGLSAGGLPDSSIVTADIADAAITAAKLNGAQSGSAPIYAARAWVNFNGTGTVAIRGSGNVSSITDNGTGDYTVNFTTALQDADFSAVGTVGAADSGSRVLHNRAFASGSIRIQTTNGAGTLGDYDTNSVAVFR